MIFLTVGSQLSFDRLTKAVDEWAANHPEIEIFGQIGITNYTPLHMRFSATLSPLEYQSKIEDAEIIVSHVGMGTVITALDKGIPLLVMPRQAEHGEHRNNHQFSSLKLVRQYELIHVADNESEIADLLDKMIVQCKDTTFEPEQLNVSPELVEKINTFINSDS